VKTVAGQQLLKDKIAVTLPIKMTPDEVKKLSADTSKGEYNDAENMWYFYDATYEITNNAKFTMPKAINTGFFKKVKHHFPITQFICFWGFYLFLGKSGRFWGNFFVFGMYRQSKNK